MPHSSEQKSVLGALTERQDELGKSLHGMSEALGLISQCSQKLKTKDYQEARVARWSGLTEQPMSSSVEGSSGVFNKEGILLTRFTKIIWLC